MNTAALIVIGDEILTGKVRDENSFVFANTMFNRGVRVERIVVIPDDIDIIAKLVLECSEHYNYVCTSGGVGPTHDDKTFEGIAKAFNRPIKEHAGAISYFQEAQKKAGRGQDISLAQMKMLCLPTPCKVHFLAPMWLPLVQVENVFIYPGVPFLFEKFMLGCAELFLGGRFYRQIIYTDKAEVAIADDLGRIQDKFALVAIGSYPQIPKSSYGVMVTIEGTSEQEVVNATGELLPLIDGRFAM